MKQENNLYHFESYEELRNYIAKGYPAKVYLTTYMDVSVCGGKVVTSKREGLELVSIPEWRRKEGYVCPADIYPRRVLGPLETFPATDYAVRTLFSSIDINADTWLDGLYKAGEHRASCGVADKSEHRTEFTAKELATPIAKGGPLVEWPADNTETLYRIHASTGVYQVSTRAIFDMINRAEKLEGVTITKRRRFSISPAKAERENVLARLSFYADNTLPALKRCWTKNDPNPVMNQPAIELGTGILVCSQGQILVAHKVSDFKSEIIKEPKFDCVSLPREITQMKGTISVEVMEEGDELAIVAYDTNGKQGVVRQAYKFPKWRGIIPSKVGPAIHLNAQAMSKAIKQVEPRANKSSKLVTLMAKRGENDIQVSVEDEYSDNNAIVTVPVTDGIPCGIAAGVQADLMQAVLAFKPAQIHFADIDKNFVYTGQNMVILQLPRVLPGEREEYTEYIPTKEELVNADLEAWLNAEPSFKPAAKPIRKMTPAKTQPVSKPEPERKISLAEELRNRLMALAA